VSQRFEVGGLLACTELVLEAHAIHLTPMFNEPAVSDTEDVDDSKRHAFSRWRDAHEFPPVCAPPGHAQHHLVVFCDQVLNRGLEIRECSAKQACQMFDALATCRDAGSRGERLG
jgi:hypothetical protein